MSEVITGGTFMRIANPWWRLTLATGLLLAGCKPNKEAEAAPRAQATTPAPQPAAPAPAPAMGPVSDATLAYLEPLPDKQCRLMQLTPPGEPRAVFTFPTPCGFTLAWRPDGLEVLASPSHWHLLRDDPRIYGWRVDLATGKLSSLSSLPPRGTLALLGFDKKGRTVALMEERYVEGSDTPSALRMVQADTGEDTPPKQQLLFEGKRYDLEPDGEPGLAHAYRLEKNGTWTRFETKGTSYGFHDSSEYLVLEAFNAMAPVDRYPGTHPGSVEGALEDVPEYAPDFAALNEVREPSDIGSWKQLQTAAGPLYIYAWKYQGNGETEPELALVRLRGKEGLVEPEGLSSDRTLSVNMRGKLVLLQSYASDGKRVARLWNVKTRKIVAVLENKDTLTFWPKP
jgi:hypothetical protein